MYDNTCSHILDAHGNIQNSLPSKEIGELTKARDLNGGHCYKTCEIFAFRFMQSHLADIDLFYLLML